MRGNRRNRRRDLYKIRDFLKPNPSGGKPIPSDIPHKPVVTKTRELTEVAVISALYVALTYLIAPIAYGPIQFRVSEALVILVAARRHLILFVPVGCVVANLLSPYAGVWDLVFMPVMSTVGALPLFFLGRRFVLPACWFYAVVTGLSVALMISVVENAGFAVLALTITTSQVLIMTAGFLFFSGYLLLLGGKKEGAGKGNTPLD